MEKLTPDRLFYYLTEAVQTRYYNADETFVHILGKEEFYRREALYDSIKELEDLYKKAHPILNITINEGDAEWLLKLLEVKGVGHQEAHNISDAIIEAQKDKK